MKKILYLFIIGLFFAQHAAQAVQLNTKGIETFDKSIKVWVDFSIPAGKTTAKISASVYSGNTKMLGPEVFTATATSTNFVLDTSSLWDNTTYTLKVTDDVPQSDTITTDFLNKNSAPRGTTKAGTGDFYYTTSYDINVYETDLHASFFRFTSAALCTASWQKEIDDYYTTPAIGGIGRRAYEFTPCFQSTGKVPTKTEFLEKMKPYGTFNSSVPLYYYTWRQADRSWGGSIGYKTKEACDTDEKTQSGMGIVTHCTASNTPPMKPANWNDTEQTTTDVSAGIEVTPYNSDYHLLAPIGGLTTVDAKTSIGDYLNIIFKIAIGLMGALAVIMIVIHGVQYMGDESVFGKTEAKHSIMTTIGGLLLALCAYALLNTINPDLLGGDGVSIDPVTITISNGLEYRLSQTLARDVTFRRTSYYKQIKDFVAQADYSSKGYPNKIHHCMAQVAVQRESNGDPSVIGHDENAPNAGVGSRVIFINSGKKSSGTTFTPSPAFITDKSGAYRNDDNGNSIFSAKNPNAADLGLDWRFSHGVGLMQTTFFPDGDTRGTNYKQAFSTPITGTKLKVKDFLDPQKAISAGVEHLQFTFKQCGGDVEKAYRAYGGGGCAGYAYSIVEAKARKSLYDQCLAQDN